MLEKLEHPNVLQEHMGQVEKDFGGIWRGIWKNNNPHPSPLLPTKGLSASHREMTPWSLEVVQLVRN